MKKKILVIGASHIHALRRAVKKLGLNDYFFIDCRPFLPTVDRSGMLNPQLMYEINRVLVRHAPKYIITSLGGNQHTVLSILNGSEPFDFTMDSEPEGEVLENRKILKESEVRQNLEDRLSNLVFAPNKSLSAQFKLPIFLIEPPPPVPEDHIREYPGIFKEKIQEFGISPISLRYKMWQLNSTITKEFCEKNSFGFIGSPKSCINSDGSLVSEALNKDPTHGNISYGLEVIKEIENSDLSSLSKNTTISPYKNLPDHCFWKRSVSNLSMSEIDPVVHSPFQIQSNEKIVTAGSCFAQHIARYLKKNGFNYYITENGLDIGLSEEEIKEGNYGVFSARFGNIYTTTQLLQLLLRANNEFSPSEEYWMDEQDNFIDPFRPQIQPGGFRSLKELQIDKAIHLERTLSAFREMDIFAFTLGLTESWISKEDNSVYPLCPGVAGGKFDPEKHEFKNFSVAEVTSDLRTFIRKLNQINPKCKIILTVSPVPLIATFENRHVISSTTYSKSVLRVASEEICNEFAQVNYFPSYEIITSHFNRGSFFSDDLRSVSQEGVNFVMSLFQKHYLVQGKRNVSGNNTDEVSEMLEVICDEEALDKNT